MGADVDDRVAWSGRLVDGSRLPVSTGPLPGLVVSGESPDEVLAGWLQGCAELVPAGVQPVVNGSGPLAVALRALLDAVPASDNAPAAIIDTTGAPEEISSALESCEDRGLLVLAALPPIDDVLVDVYTHIHRRGLTLRVVRPAPRAGETAHHVATSVLEGVRCTSSSEPLGFVPEFLLVE